MVQRLAEASTSLPTSFYHRQLQSKLLLPCRDTAWGDFADAAIPKSAPNAGSPVFRHFRSGSTARQSHFSLRSEFPSIPHQTPTVRSSLRRHVRSPSTREFPESLGPNCPPTQSVCHCHHD